MWVKVHLKGKKAVQKKEEKGRARESGCWWKWTLCLQSLRWHLLQLKTSFIQTQNDFFSEAFWQSDTERPFYQFPPNRGTCSGHDFSFSDVPICRKFHGSWCVSEKPQFPAAKVTGTNWYSSESYWTNTELSLWFFFLNVRKLDLCVFYYLRMLLRNFSPYLSTL